MGRKAQHRASMLTAARCTLGGTLLLSAVCALPPRAAAQQLPQALSFELDLPDDGPLRRGQGRRVTVNSGARSVVALVHAEVGDRRLVILPDGRLDSLPATEAPLTDEPFRPATKDEIAAELKRRGFGDFKVRATTHFVYVYNTSDVFYNGTRGILETMYPGVLSYFKRLKLNVHHPEVPLVAVMFRTEEEFRKFDAVPETVAAYYHPITNHIVMYEQSDLVEVAPDLAVRQAIGTIAHEGIHQILHNIGVQQRLSRWPTWVSEGLAEYFAPTTVDKRLRWKGIGVPNDLRMYELDKTMKKNREKPGKLIEQVTGAGQLTSSGYAAAWSLTHYLAARKKTKFHDYLRELAALAPLEPRQAIVPADRRAAFARHFGSDFAAIENDLVKHLRGLPYLDPIANQTHYVVLIDTALVRSVGVTTSPADVRRWQQETLAKLPAAERAATRFQILPFANKDQADRYADRFLGKVD